MTLRMPQRAADIRAIAITLRVREKNALFILLAADGAINRLGTGSVRNTENDMFIGQTTEPLFEQVRATFHDEMLGMTGGYDVPNQKGKPCVLDILLRFADGTEDGFRFSYGSKSQGPPGEIVNVVMRAVEVTEPWFERQKAMVRAQR